MAPQLKGYLLFAEHRYFGESLPFGNNSFTKENLVYLTTDQALADYAVFIRYYKTQVLKCPDCPVIAFGGSYGGMLAAWMRMKFPNVVDGALAASAPIRMFNNVVDPELFYQIISWDFGNATTTTCAISIREGLRRLTNYSKINGNQYQAINKYFNLCPPLTSNKNISDVVDWATNAYFFIAMLDYPFASSYVTSMPAWPRNFACQAFIGVNESSSDQDLFTALYKSSMIYYDYPNKTSCNNIYNPNSGSK